MHNAFDVTHTQGFQDFCVDIIDVLSVVGIGFSLAANTAMFVKQPSWKNFYRAHYFEVKT